MKRVASLFLIVFLVLLSFSLISCSNMDIGVKDGFEGENGSNVIEGQNESSVLEEKDESNIVGNEIGSHVLAEGGSYTSKEDVSLYLHIYDKLPNNYLKKKKQTN